MSIEKPVASGDTVSSGKRARSTAAGCRSLPEGFQRQVSRFPVSSRPAIRALVRKVPLAADLAHVFPGLLHAIASRHGSEAQRDACLAMLERGAQLKIIAKTLDLPMWLRRLPPEVFVRDLSHLPLSDSFARRVQSRVPARPADCVSWLESVRFANRAAGEDFALWIARQRSACHSLDAEWRLGILAAYAWYSRNPLEDAHRLIWSRWRSEMSLETAVCASKSWFNRILLLIHLPQNRPIDPWLSAMTLDTFSFVPLTSAEALLAESRAMNNCADQYAMAIASDRCRLFSVRREGMRVATLEITPHIRERGAFAIAQLKANCNVPAGLDIWQATYRWMAEQPRLLDAATLATGVRSEPDEDVWTQVFGGYRSLHDGAPWIPSKPTIVSIRNIELGLAALARDCAIRSWLFT